MSATTCMQLVPQELLAEARADVLRFCESIIAIPDHESHCGKLCGEIRALNGMMQQDPLDAMVLLPQIFCIRTMADVTDEHDHRHVFAKNRNAEFLYKDQNGNIATKNIMHVIDRMEMVLIDLCSHFRLVETDYNSRLYLLGKLRSLNSTQEL